MRAGSHSDVVEDGPERPGSQALAANRPLRRSRCLPRELRDQRGAQALPVERSARESGAYVLRESENRLCEKNVVRARPRVETRLVQPLGSKNRGYERRSDFHGDGGARLAPAESERDPRRQEFQHHRRRVNHLPARARQASLGRRPGAGAENDRVLEEVALGQLSDPRPVHFVQREAGPDSLARVRRDSCGHVCGAPSTQLGPSHPCHLAEHRC